MAVGNPRDTETTPSIQNVSTIGGRLKYARNKKGLSQGDAAEGLEMSQSFISQCERNECQISLTTLMPIVAFYGA